MNEIFKKIYDTVICYEKDSLKTGRHVEEEIKDIMQPYEGKIGMEEQEKLKDLLSGAALAAQREGFLLGVRYALKALIAVLSD